MTLALVKLNPADVPQCESLRTRLGAGRQVSARSSTTGEKVYSYGNSELRGGVLPAEPEDRRPAAERGQRLES